MALHLVVLGTLQLLAATCADAVREHARCWLRTPSGNVPSDYVSRTALANLLYADMRGLGKNPVTESIRRMQTPPQESCNTTIARKRKAAYPMPQNL